MKLNIETILIALPALSTNDRKKIEKIISFSVNVKTLPNIDDLAAGNISFSKFQKIEIEDLLRREVTPPKQELLKANIEDRVVLVTGAGGSIGGELCRQIVKLGPKILILLDQNEHALYSINEELSQTKFIQSVEIIALLSSTLDKTQMENLFCLWRPDTVFHAAAHKHVPIVEQRSN